ncbi:MAG: hypothetical protein IJB65_04670 [Clostridia bacterium]|nr:hypothetical protein [Clostridia bacterium]
MLHPCLTLKKAVNKRILAAILAACTLLCLCACNKEIENITCKNTVGGYSFDYPENWELLKEGASSFISIGDVGGAVPYATASFSMQENDGETAKEHWQVNEEFYAMGYESFELIKAEEFDFKGGTAMEISAEVTVVGFTNLDGQPDKAEGKAVYVLRQLIFVQKDKRCVVSYMASKANDKEYGGAMTSVKKSFKFTDAKEETAEDKNIADFEIPTPEGWSLKTAEAYYTLTRGSASITASVFSVKDNATTAKDCWENVYVPDFTANFEEYKLVGELKEDVKLGGAPAVEAQYTLSTVTGNTYSFRQITAVYYGYVYTVVLTASAEDYEDCMAGFDAVVTGFSFK